MINQALQQRKRWGTEEDNYLTKNYLNSSKEKLMTQLNRSWIGIRHRASKLNLEYRGIRRDHKFLDSLTELEKGYIAGILDGEGCITFERRRKDKFLIRPQISIINTDLELLKFCQGIIGGRIDKGFEKNKHWKQKFVLVLPHNKEYLKWFINQIESSLIAKKEKLNIIKEFIKVREKVLENTWRRYAQYSSIELNLYDKMRILNKRGPTDVKEI